MPNNTSWQATIVLMEIRKQIYLQTSIAHLQPLEKPNSSLKSLRKCTRAINKAPSILKSAIEYKKHQANTLFQRCPPLQKTKTRKGSLDLI